MLDEKVVASKTTLPLLDDFDRPAEVISMQATFISGGLLLCFSAQHNCMDIAGQCEVMRLFAKACRGGRFSQEEVEIGNVSRYGATMLSKAEIDAKPLRRPEEAEKTQQCSGPAQPKSPQPTSQVAQVAPERQHDCGWAYMIFPSSNLATLKARATATLPSSFPGTYISTDDALSAYIWQIVTRAELPHGSADTALERQERTTTLDRIVDARSYVDLPKKYTGNCTYKTSTTLPTFETSSLGLLASHLRTELLRPETITSAMQASAAKICDSISSGALAKDSTIATKDRRFETEKRYDVKVSSWAKEKCYEFDFGGKLGKPVAVRRPGFEAREGLTFFMPKGLDGSIVVAVCLREERLNRLREEVVIDGYGEWIG